MQLWKKSVIVIVVVIVGWLLFTKVLFKASTSPTYQTAQVTRGTIVAALTGSGIVSTANNVEVTTQASGVVKKITVKNGDSVKSGQKIADLELDEEGRQRYSSALSSYQSAQNALAGSRASLYSQQSSMFAANQKFINGAAAQDLATNDPTYIQQNADWLAAEANYKRQLAVITQSQNALNAASISLRQSSPSLYAPISGKLSGFSLQLGSVITAQTTTSGSSSSQKIANVTTNAIPTISVNITQIDVPKLAIGDKATITLDAYTDKTFTGKVVSIDTVGSATSGVTSYPTVIALDEVNPDIFPNMSATANIITDSKTDVLIVPSSAVKTSNGESSVQTMDKNGKISTVSVTIGISSDSETEIISGLSEGDTVVTAVIAPKTTTTNSTGGTSVFSTFGAGRGVGGAAGGGNVRVIRGN
ncbi:MAG TPA: efflux RND transporter periplasmic adaptor subunit [Patescibacteria group bacterium]|nr:efflux RND transporter periplasmic adaptor subunit [Patescibacteria group bacterium]